jgi:hypothetical protein
LLLSFLIWYPKLIFIITAIAWYFHFWLQQLTSGNKLVNTLQHDCFNFIFSFLRCKHALFDQIGQWMIIWWDDVSWCLLPELHWRRQQDSHINWKTWLPMRTAIAKTGSNTKSIQHWQIMSIPQIRFQNESLLCNLLH